MWSLWLCTHFHKRVAEKNSSAISVTTTPISFMNWSFMHSQVVIFCEASTTSVALKRLLSFMNWNHICFQTFISYKIGITNIGFNDFFPSWTDDMCVFDLFFSAKEESQIVHSNCLFVHELKFYALSSWLHSITNNGLKRLVSIMNWNHVNFQLAFFCKRRIYKFDIWLTN